MNGGSELVSGGSLRGLPYLLLQTVFSWDVPFCHNTKRHRQDRQTACCDIGSTFQSTVGQKPSIHGMMEYTKFWLCMCGCVLKMGCHINYCQKWELHNTTNILSLRTIIIFCNLRRGVRKFTQLTMQLLKLIFNGFACNATCIKNEYIRHIKR